MVRDPRVRGGTLRRAFGGASMRGGRSTAQASSMAGPEHADPVMVRDRPRSGQTKGGSGGGRACSCPPKDRASALRALGVDRRRRSLVPCHRATDRRPGLAGPQLL